MLDANALARGLAEQVVMLVWGLGRYSHRYSTQIALSSLTGPGGRPVVSHTTAPLSGAATVASIDPFVL